VELQSLLALTGLAVLSLTHSSVTDAGLRGVGQTLTALAELGLSSCTRLTDEGLRALSPLTGLKSLDLSLTNVTEEGLRALAPLTRLEYLVISRPAPTVSLYHCYCITVTVSLLLYHCTHIPNYVAPWRVDSPPARANSPPAWVNSPLRLRV